MVLQDLGKVKRDRLARRRGCRLAVVIVGWECSVVSGPAMAEMAVMVSSTVLAVEGAGVAVVMAGRVRVKVDGAVVMK